MNLVIDDAVEVKLATKAEEESRRQLGKWALSLGWNFHY
jgi:small nuclear ribonucleoprotein E